MNEVFITLNITPSAFEFNHLQLSFLIEIEVDDHYISFLYTTDTIRKAISHYDEAVRYIKRNKVRLHDICNQNNHRENLAILTDYFTRLFNILYESNEKRVCNKTYYTASTILYKVENFALSFPAKDKEFYYDII